MIANDFRRHAPLPLDTDRPYYMHVPHWGLDRNDWENHPLCPDCGYYRVNPYPPPEERVFRRENLLDYDVFHSMEIDTQVFPIISEKVRQIL